jgi:hypothetical protein
LLSFGHSIVCPSLRLLITPLLSLTKDNKGVIRSRKVGHTIQWPKDNKGVIRCRKGGHTIQWPKDNKGVIRSRKEGHTIQYNGQKITRM